MCEHCRSKGNPQEIKANFSYTKSEDGEHESRSMVSKALNKEELGDVVHHLLVGLKTYADRVCKISHSDFDKIVVSYLSVEFTQEEPIILEPESNKIPLYYN